MEVNRNSTCVSIFIGLGLILAGSHVLGQTKQDSLEIGGKTVGCFGANSICKTNC